MKYLKYAAVVLIVLAVTAAAIHFYRESIARGFANSALRGQGITVSELSIETLTTNNVRLSYLALEQDDGTRYEISGLSFPVSFPSMQPELISIEKLVLVPAPVDDAPLPLARLLQTFLKLPVSAPNTEIRVSRFMTPGAPSIGNIVWRSRGRQQHLALIISPGNSTIEIVINVDDMNNGDHQATVLATVDGNADALSMAVAMHRSNTGFTIDAAPNFNFSRWLPVLESANLLPDDIVLLSAEIDGPVTVVLNNDETLPVTATVRVSLDMGRLRLGTVTLGSTKVSASLAFAIGETTVISISPELGLELRDIDAQSFAVESVSATRFSGVRLTTDDGGWRGDIDHLELAFDSLSNRAELIVSAPVTFSGLRLRNNAATIDAQVSVSPNAVNISWDGIGMATPRVDGRVSLRDHIVAASLTLSGNDGALTARIDASHNLESSEGSITVSDAALRFGQSSLSDYFLQWPYAWDIVAGSWTTDFKMDWNTGKNQTEYSGTVTNHARTLAGNYDDYAFSGLNTTLTGRVSSATGVTLTPSSIKIELLDVGLPFRRIAADFVLYIDQRALQVQNLSMSVLGGKLVADPFHFSLQEERNDILLRPESIQLQFMARLAEFENIELSGSLSGVIPITIHDETITITNGRLESDPPGGVIRYLPGVATEDAPDSDSGIGLVSRALANFQFDSLTSDVNYMENGDLKLQMKLTGVNPDMDANQPVILNLGVENNIPQLLRSLRATRSIEEILERKSGN